MLEEHCVADSGMTSVGDVDLVTSIMIPRIADIESTGGVRCPRFADCWDEMGLDSTSEWSKWIGVVVMLLPEIGVG